MNSSCSLSQGTTLSTKHASYLYSSKAAFTYRSHPHLIFFNTDLLYITPSSLVSRAKPPPAKGLFRLWCSPMAIFLWRLVFLFLFQCPLATKQPQASNKISFDHRASKQQVFDKRIASRTLQSLEPLDDHPEARDDLHA